MFALVIVIQTKLNLNFDTYIEHQFFMLFFKGALGGSFKNSNEAPDKLSENIHLL